MISDDVTTATKRCSKCRVFLPYSTFSTNPSRKDGYANNCRTCANVSALSSYYRTRGADPVGVWARFALYGAKTRAKRRGLPFTLTKAAVLAMVTATCPVFGVPLDYTGGTFGRHGAGPYSATIDRIRGELGYTPENSIVISMRANLIKQDATPEEIRRVADFYASLRPPLDT